MPNPPPLPGRSGPATLSLLLCAVVVLACSTEAPELAAAVNASAAKPRPASARPGLVLHAENEDGTVVETADAESAINPASLVKAATTLWAIEALGPEHRFETRFGYRGTFDAARGILQGDLIVSGAGDPDFHVENAYLVAAELNRLGLREVRGNLRVTPTFWLGWEGGSEKVETDRAIRAGQMATRLLRALDPTRWNAGTLRSIERFEARRGFTPADRPRVAVTGSAEGDFGDGPVEALAVHRSNPLAVTLKRFNAYSNNDIERLGSSLGSAADLAARLTRLLAAAPGTVRLTTLSGLETNRLTPRQVVGILRELARACEAVGLSLGDVLPVAGCDPGTLKHYPRLQEQLAGNLTAKTGTLNVTDAGVSVLAGVLETARGKRIFCVATPRAGGRQSQARAQQEQWVLDLVVGGGGADPAACGAPPGFSDQSVEVAPAEGAAAAASVRDRTP